jgi:pimeloyl-ACP methyl ester carboxylesterase
MFPLTLQAQEASPTAMPYVSPYTWEGDIDAGAGRKLHAACYGEGPVTVVIETGGPDPLGGITAVAPVIPALPEALGTKVCAYDRANSGLSDAIPGPLRTIKDSAKDLAIVLASQEIGCPCLLVGASHGGAIALELLASDPANVAGMLLLDPVYPGSLGDYSALVTPGSPEAAQLDDMATGAWGENIDVAASYEGLSMPAAPATIPVEIIVHGVGNPPPCNYPVCTSPDFPMSKLEASWQAGEARLAVALGAKLSVDPNAGHDIAGDNPIAAIQAAGELIAAILDPATWATPIAS